MNNIDQLIEEQSKNLPQNVVEAINLVNWKNKVQKISLLLSLNSEQAKELEMEVLLLIYSFEPRDNFLENLIENIKIDSVTAEKIADLVESEIVIPIAREFDRLSSKPKENIIPPVSTSKEVELPPVILPMIEPGEVVHDTPPQPKIEPVAPQIIPSVVPPVTPAELKVEFTAHTTPQTISTPVVPPAPSAPKSIVEEKMSGAVSTSVPTSYQAGEDPYREPIQ